MALFSQPTARALAILDLLMANPQQAFGLAKKMIQYGILIVTAFGDASTLMFEPPLVITKKQLKTVAETFDKVCKELSDIEKE